MNKKKFEVMSLSIDPELHSQLKFAAKKQQASVSKVLRDLVEKHLDLVANDGNEIPIILRVPAQLKGDEEGLKNWFSGRVDGIVKKLSES